jgi:hypothetical protein
VVLNNRWLSCARASRLRLILGETILTVYNIAAPRPCAQRVRLEPISCRRDAIPKGASLQRPQAALCLPRLNFHIGITRSVTRILLILALLVMPREPGLDLPEASISTVCQHLAYNAAVVISLVVVDLDRLAIHQT